VPANNLRFAALDLNPWVIGFALLLATVSGALAGLWPAWKLSRADLRTSLHDGGRAATSGSALRRVLVGAQVALTLVLLSVSGLILRSLDRMQAAPLGYDPRSLLVFSLALPENRYGNTPDRARDFYFQLVDKLRTLPGVTDAAVTTTPPLETGWQSSFAVEGVHRPTENNLPLAEMNLVTDDYFRTLGVPLLQGRSFLPTDQKGPPVAIIDQAFAQKYWPGKSALGQRIHWTMGETEADNWFTVVGIVPTLQVYGYGEAPVRPQAYLTSRQFCPPAQIVVVRTTGNPRLLEREVRQVLAALEPEISLFDLTTMEEMIASTYQNTALQSRLLTAFSVLAFLLALTGLYSVVAYGVGLRQREIGVRLALGADGASVVRLMLRQGLVPLAVGALVGLAGAILAGRAVQSQLYQVSPLDPLTLIAATLVLALAAAVASWLPARRAAQVDPMIALRAE
jgi:predicted permease